MKVIGKPVPNETRKVKSDNKKALNARERQEENMCKDPQPVMLKRPCLACSSIYLSDRRLGTKRAVVRRRQEELRQSTMRNAVRCCDGQVPPSSAITIGPQHGQW
jgi:hypothetical protein